MAISGVNRAIGGRTPNASVIKEEDDVGVSSFAGDHGTRDGIRLDPLTMYSQ